MIAVHVRLFFRPAARALASAAAGFTTGIAPEPATSPSVNITDNHALARAAGVPGRAAGAAAPGLDFWLRDTDGLPHGGAGHRVVLADVQAAVRVGELGDGEQPTGEA